MFKKSLTVLMAVSAFYGVEALALMHTGATVTAVGQEGLGVQVFVGITPNTNGCTYGGVYFSSNNPNILALPLSVALAAKMAQKTIRVDYTKQADGQCVGSNIYVE